MTGDRPPPEHRLRFGFGTNGFADHRLTDALAILADLGYDGVALTLDHHHLDPYAPELARRVRQVADRLSSLGLGVVVATGARYLLDPWHKHQPTLLSEPGSERRLDLLRRAVCIGADLGAEAVSFWSGTAPPGLAEPVAWQRLAERCEQLLATAEVHDMRLGFEPEPGMFVETIAGFERLRKLLGDPDRLGLTLDIGHCPVREPEPPDQCVRRTAGQLIDVQIDDSRGGVHEHLELGQGEIDFPPVLAELAAQRFRGLVSVELPRHSHAAPYVAAHSLRFLQAAAACRPAPPPRSARP